MKIMFYHGSDQLVKTLEPRGINMGAIGDVPKWSIYLWKDYRLAYNWAIYQYCRRNTNLDLAYHIPTNGFLVREDEYSKLLISVLNKYAYVYHKTLDEREVGYGASPFIDEYTYDNKIIPDKIDRIKITKYILDGVVLVVSKEDLNSYRNNLIKDGFLKQRKLPKGIRMDPLRDFERQKYYKLIRIGRLKIGDDLNNVSLENKIFRL